MKHNQLKSQVDKMIEKIAPLGLIFLKVVQGGLIIEHPKSLSNANIAFLGVANVRKHVDCP